MSVETRTNKHIRATWDRFNGSGQMSTVTIDEVKNFAEQRGLVIESVEEVEFGSNPRIKAIQLKTDLGTALYPRKKLNEIEIYNHNIEPNQNYANFWKSVDWFSPPYITNGAISDAINNAGINAREHSHWNKRGLQSRFEPHLSSIYTLGNIIPITVQTLTESEAISKHLPIIKESILAFYSGMKVVAVAALIPIIEDILGSIIGEDSSGLDIMTKVNKSIDLACDGVTKLHINHSDWIPPEYIENSVLKVMNTKIFTLETIRYWLLNSFYEKTDNYDKHSGFNRHFFAHAKSDIWQNEHNFFRAMGLIQALAFIECFAVAESKVSIFPPEPDERAESFRLEVFACMNTQLFKKRILNQLQIDNNLPFNPTASDDGWLLRASKLSEKMNLEIIPNLRDKGWQCHSFTDPVKEGEYITVKASKGDREIKISLLYTCATGNDIYKELVKSCDFILYQGAYYHQESYAFGVMASVLPLNAWITPD
ncbi:hypothetical protein [Shewanella psychromarinicola]|uniref:Uncharacterized protein n=1 Tax=Shewanella psychromarinicola TaxID=2487742 RepID=A0A3N4DF05_9GAMM|nr:hypothetical protein [Shewanella psychromarinicola]AZG33801.1 hypothetical protein EGC80_01910 [Shewanella psychromarinicola]MCL1084455.1 hypothetical protein [Shewanella psychromarinicola]RPA22408.1 hypothetical protein EGC77_22265 [Shewanella psychromarinicola]